MLKEEREGRRRLGNLSLVGIQRRGGEKMCYQLCFPFGKRKKERERNGIWHELGRGERDPACNSVHGEKGKGKRKKRSL